MKKILFLLLFPSLALAQYQGNANQKITLGEQTTADGLVFRGVLNDTALITPLSDTSAYIILDTVNNRFYNYNRTTNVWSVAGGGTAVTSITGGTGLIGGTITSTGTLAADTSFLFTQSDTLALNLTSRFASKLNIADTTNMLLPYFRDADTTTLNLTSRFAAKQNNLTLTTTGTSGAATLTGDTLNIPQYSGGGGVDSTAIKYVNTYGTQTVNGAKTFTSAVTATRFNPTANTVTGTGMYLPAANTIGFSTNDSLRLEITSTGTVNFLNNIFLSGTNSILSQTPTNSRAEDNAAAFFNTNTNGYGLYIAGGGGPINGVYRHSLYVTDPARLYAFFKVGGDGNVGIGTYDPKSKLNVMGTVRINSVSAPDANYYLQLENSASQKAKANAWDTYSDKRIKTDIQPILNAIDKVNSLNPVYYQKHDSYVENDFLNIDFDNSVKSLGFIAQEVYNVIPEAVNTGTTNELWAMDYTKIIPILTKAIQEQQALIKALEQRIINLENK
jgi:hypothetical protein